MNYFLSTKVYFLFSKYADMKDHKSLFYLFTVLKFFFNLFSKYAEMKDNKSLFYFICLQYYSLFLICFLSMLIWRTTTSSSSSKRPASPITCGPSSKVRDRSTRFTSPTIWVTFPHLFILLKNIFHIIRFISSST